MNGWVRRAKPAAGSAAEPGLDWKRLPAFPVSPGRAGLLAGSQGGALIAAGGAYFPDLPPWEGGVKRYESDIQVLPPGESAWKPAGSLPAPRGYGAVVSLPDEQGVVVLGGENAERFFSDCLLLNWNGRSVEVRENVIPELPFPLTSPSAVVLDGWLYLAGGYAPGTPRLSRSECWRLNLHPATGQPLAWEPLQSWPGPSRAMAVMAALEGKIYLISGLEVGEGRSPVYLSDAYRYDPRGAEWTRLPDLPWSALAAPSPAPTASSPARLFVLGGVDGTQAGKVPRDTPLPSEILSFDPAAHRWQLWPESWPTPVVTTPAVPVAGGGWALISGEILPGKRTTAGWVWRPSP